MPIFLGTGKHNALEVFSFYIAITYIRYMVLFVIFLNEFSIDNQQENFEIVAWVLMEQLPPRDREFPT